MYNLFLYFCPGYLFIAKIESKFENYLLSSQLQEAEYDKNALVQKNLSTYASLNPSTNLEHENSIIDFMI